MDGFVVFCVAVVWVVTCVYCYAMGHVRGQIVGLRDARKIPRSK
jgi:hypothetical protein